MTPELFLDLALNPAFRLMPVAMNTPAAQAMVIAICLQESGLTDRVQQAGGPARGYAQFERGGVEGILMHRVSGAGIKTICEQLDIKPNVDSVHAALQYHDVMTVVCARYLLWTLPVPLPGREDRILSYGQYAAGWRPGKPRPETWDTNFAEAWRLIDNQEKTS